MELLYTEQTLVAGQLNNSYNKISNTEIVRPSWKGNKTYGDTFFVKKRPGINQSAKNVPAGDIVDNMFIDGVEYLLIHNGAALDVAYDDGVNFVSMGYPQTIGDNTPLQFIKGRSGKGEITTGVTIGDPYFDTHYVATWNILTSYDIDQIVEFEGLYYQATTNNVGIEPFPLIEADWKIYVTDLSGYQVEDPSTIEYRDVYKGGYLKMKLKKTAVRDKAIVGSYVLFTTNSSNLQGITTEIHYAETTYINYAGTEVALPDDEVYVYIRGTNYAGTLPFVGEAVYITTEVGNIPIIATDTKIISLHITLLAGEVTGLLPVTIYTAADGDYITDLCVYNGAIFILTRDVILFSRTLLTSNINIYPLDVFLNVKLLGRMIPFGKTLVLFGENNAVLIPVVGTTGTEGYVLSDLHYTSKLYSKYSVISSMGSLYVLQDDRQFMQIDITSENNIDYMVTTTNAISLVRGQFDFIVGEIFMCEWDKQVYILDKTSNETYYYKYDIEYKHWDTGDYLTAFYKIEDKLYGQGLYEFNTEFFDNTDDYREQVVGFDFGGETLTTLKEVVMVKMIFGLNEKILDYELVVQYELGGILHSKTIDLNNYPINLEIGTGDAGLGDSVLQNTLLGNGVAYDTVAIGNFVSVTVGLGLTASVFNFEIKSKENGFVYGGSIIGYINKIPTVTEFNYKH